MAFTEYHRMRVLVLDDFDGFRSTVTRMLESFGVPKVDSVSNADDAFKLCEKERYHAILSDYNLGKGQTGLQLLEALRFHGLIDHRQVFALVSAENSKQIILAASDVEPDAYLSKPITAKALYHRLDRILVQRQQLKPLFIALDRQEHHRAMALCRDHISHKGYQTGFCQKLLGQLLLQEQNWREAEKIYRSVLEVRSLEWAKLGMAQIKQYTGELPTAERWFRDLIKSNPLCLAAYDGLATVYEGLQDDANLQKVLQQAVDVSPLALLRQQSLAYAANRNHDYQTSVKAFRKVLRLAEYSVYQTPQQNLDYARAVLNFHQQNPLPAAEYSRDAVEKLALVASAQQSSDIRMQSLLLQTQLFAVNRDQAQAKKQYHAAEDIAEAQPEIAETFPVQFEKVKTLRELGQLEASDQLLHSLCDLNRDNEPNLEILDTLLAEPRSSKNRLLIAQINKTGIRHYQAKQYGDAIAAFTKAKELFPEHIGVRLNLTQVLIDDMQQYGCKEDLMAQVDATLEFVASVLKPNHEQYRRYVKLKELRQALARGTN